MKLISFVLLSILLSLSCTSNEKQKSSEASNKPIDSFESAIPHGKTLLNTEFSDEDRVKLARAKGKKAENISFDSLKLLIEQDNSGLVIYNFWNIDCLTCKKTVDILKNLQHQQFEKEAFKVVYVNIDDLYPEMINSFIREKQMIDQVYTVAMDSIPNWASYFQSDWDGQLPAILIVNNLDGTRLFYEKEFTLEELQALLLPLTM